MINTQGRRCMNKLNIFSIIRTAWQYDKRDESNRQMIARIGIKFLLLLFLIMMFDSLFDWFLDFSHFIILLIHLLVESIEHWLSLLLEQALQTDRQQSVLIIVSSTIIIVLYGLHRLYISTPKLYTQCKHALAAIWVRWLTSEATYWQFLPLKQKIYLLLFYIFNLTSLIFLITL